MSRARSVRGVGILVAVALAIGLAGCSSDGESTTTTERGALSFGQPPETATRLGLCKAYQDDQMKKVLGDDGYRKLAPAAIGKKGDAVTGERCSWERLGGGDTKLSLSIEATDYGADAAGLEAHFGELHDRTLGASDVADLGDEAFSSISDETSLLQVRSGPYLVTLATQATGKKVEPVKIEVLQLLAASALEQLP